MHEGVDNIYIHDTLLETDSLRTAQDEQCHWSQWLHVFRTQVNLGVQPENPNFGYTLPNQLFPLKT